MQTQFSLDLDFAKSLLSEGLAQANQQEALLNVEEQNLILILTYQTCCWHIVSSSQGSDRFLDL